MATNSKYDRQLRLWGGHGQKKLCSSRILLLGATGSCSETLKNLVLPQIGTFTVVDGGKIEESDLGESFFYTPEDLGKPKAEIMCANLLELNPEDVKGNFVVQPIKDFVQTKWEDSFDLIIATNVDNNIALAVSEKAKVKEIPIILIRQYGFIGSIRIIASEVCVAEQKPYQVTMQDLRLNEPFPELLDYVKKFDLPALTDDKHAHVPYVAILIQAMEAWKAGHGGDPPKNFTEKQQFKDGIKKMARDYGQEVNFQEAIKEAFRIHQSTALSEEVKDIFTIAKIEDKSVKDPFWVGCCAVKRFYDANKRLPVMGVVPDMQAETIPFLELQTIYKDKAAADLLQCQGYLGAICMERGITWVTNPEYAEQLVLICKNAQYLQITQLNSFKNELENFVLPEEFQWSITDPEECHAWYVACRCFEDFRVANGRCPGQVVDASTGAVSYPATVSAEDIAWLKNKGKEYVAKIPGMSDATIEIDEKYFHEMVRFSDTQVHTVSAFLGGVASQEAIKIIIKQYTIFNDTFIYDGIHGRCQTFKLD